MKLSDNLYYFGRNLLAFILIILLGPIHWCFRMARLLHVFKRNDGSELLIWPWEWNWFREAGWQHIPEREWNDEDDEDEEEEKPTPYDGIKNP